MGTQPSKVASAKISEAYSEAVKSGKEKIEVDFCDSEFLNSLKELWSKVPKETQKYITGKSKPERRRKLPKQTTATFTLDESFMKKVPRWRKEPLLFFKEDKKELILSEDPLCELNTYMTKLNDRDGLSVTRFRLIQIIYHRLKEEKLCVKQLRSKDVQRLARITTQTSLPGNPDTTDPPVAEWVEQGKRIDELCRALGSVRNTGYCHLANIFFLQDISDTTIKKMPMQPKERQDAIETLKARNIHGIEDRRRLEELAHNIIHTLWEKVGNSITNSDLGWELRQIRSFQAHDTVHLIQDTQSFTGRREPSRSEDTATGAETAANNSEISTPAGSPQLRSHDRPSITITGSDLPGDAQLYNLGTDVFNTPFDASSETWTVPRPSLIAPENGNAVSPLVHSTSSQVPVHWDGQFYNLGKDVFNAPFDAPGETWDMPPPTLTASENSNSVLPPVHSTSSQVPVQWDGQVYNLGADVFNTPFDASNATWNVLPPVQPDPQQNLVNVPDKDMHFIGNSAAGFSNMAFQDPPLSTDWIVSAG